MVPLSAPLRYNVLANNSVASARYFVGVYKSAFAFQLDDGYIDDADCVVAVVSVVFAVFVGAGVVGGVVGVVGVVCVGADVVTVERLSTIVQVWCWPVVRPALVFEPTPLGLAQFDLL